MVKLDLGFYINRLEEHLEELSVVFTGAKDVYIYDVSKSFSGHGHYKINLVVYINNVEKTFTDVISDMERIDDWNGDDGNITTETLLYVINNFENEISDYIQNEI